MKSLAVLLAAALPLSAQFSIKWEHDLDAALKRAKAEKKEIFLDIWAEWCGPCQYLKSKVFPQPAAQGALAGFIPLSVMVERKDRSPVPGADAVMAKYPVEGFPTLLVLDAQGRERRRHVGAFRSGEELAAWINQK